MVMAPETYDDSKPISMKNNPFGNVTREFARKDEFYKCFKVSRGEDGGLNIVAEFKMEVVLLKDVIDENVPTAGETLAELMYERACMDLVEMMTVGKFKFEDALKTLNG